MRIFLVEWSLYEESGVVSVHRTAQGALTRLQERGYHPTEGFAFRNADDGRRAEIRGVELED